MRRAATRRTTARWALRRDAWLEYWADDLPRLRWLTRRAGAPPRVVGQVCDGSLDKTRYAIRWERRARVKKYELRRVLQVAAYAPVDAAALRWAWVQSVDEMPPGVGPRRARILERACLWARRRRGPQASRDAARLIAQASRLDSVALLQLHEAWFGDAGVLLWTSPARHPRITAWLDATRPALRRGSTARAARLSVATPPKSCSYLSTGGSRLASTCTGARPHTC
jgi:hypothetical protein